MSGGEQGLLGIAFSPDGSYLYVNFTNTSGDTRVREYAFTSGRATSPRDVLASPSPKATTTGDTWLRPGRLPVHRARRRRRAVTRRTGRRTSRAPGQDAADRSEAVRRERVHDPVDESVRRTCRPRRDLGVRSAQPMAVLFEVHRRHVDRRRRPERVGRGRLRCRRACGGDNYGWNDEGTHTYGVGTGLSDNTHRSTSTRTRRECRSPAGTCTAGRRSRT